MFIVRQYSNAIRPHPPPECILSGRFGKGQTSKYFVDGCYRDAAEKPCVDLLAFGTGGRSACISRLARSNSSKEARPVDQYG